MRILQGDTRPRAEQPQPYVLNSVIPQFGQLPFSPKKEERLVWTLYKSKNGKWEKVNGNIKYGEKNTYQFGQRVVGIPFKIMVHSQGENMPQIAESKLVAELVVTPKTAKEPVIGRVILLNRSNKDVNKATFQESLTAQARTSNLLGKEITFYLWEEGANELQKYQKPKKARVNKHGIAEVEFRLSEYAAPQTWMSFMQPNSNANKKFYVTAVYEGKKIENKTPVTASDSQRNPPPVPIHAPKPAPERQPLDVPERLKKGAEILAEGVGSFIAQVFDTGVSPSIVSPAPKPEKKENKVCECEARVRAFMRMLRVKEGTSGESGYTKLFGHSDFTKSPHNRDLSTHPDISIPFRTTSSDAAGAYQIMGDAFKNLTGYFQDKYGNWKYSEKLDKKKKYNIESFDQESQDKFCLAILKHNYTSDRNDSFYIPVYWLDKIKKIQDTKREEKARIWRTRFKGKQGDIIQFIIDDNVERAILLASLCWASLPDSPYGQQSASYTNAMVKSIYEAYLKQELIEPNSELHLKKGFLKEFGYGCCEDSSAEKIETTQNSTCPEDCSQCFEYADVIPNPKVNDQSGNKNHNRYKNEPRIKSNGKKYYHSGTDILAVVGTEVHTMMCGEVVHIRKDLPQNNYSKGYESPTSYGNTITIKSKDKTGKIVYHFYAHLSQVNVKVGEVVKHNKVIGLSGSTGNAMHVEARYRHVHVEAGTSYSTTGGSDGKQRCKINADLNPENYMKSKFDKKGNTL